MNVPELTVIVVTYNSCNEIQACLQSLRCTIRRISFEVVLVDNASQDDTVDQVRSSFPEVSIVQNACNVGFPAANNQALRLASGKYVLLLNPDTVAHEGAIEQLVGVLEGNPKIGVCGPQLVDAEGALANDLRQPTLHRIILDTLGFGNFAAKFLPPDRQEAVSGAALMFRRSLTTEVGLLDEHMFWAEDADFCLRVADAGYRIKRVDTALITHYVGRSTTGKLALYLEKQYTSRVRFLRKHARREEFWCALPVFYISVTMRLLKWYFQSVLSPSVEASVRLRAFRSLLVRMPSLFAVEAQRSRGLALCDRNRDCGGRVA